jgi:hypothetical protein
MRPTALALALGLIACGGSPSEQLATALETVLSWTATVRTVADDWLSHRAPTRYTRTTLAAALKSLEQERAALAASPKTAAHPQVAKALPLIQQAETATARMWTGVGEQDRTHVREQRATLPSLELALRGLAEPSPAP